MNLKTTYMGLCLRSPIIVGASPLTGNLTGIQELEKLGASAIVMPSLFEEQIVQEAIAETQYLDLSGNYSAFPSTSEYLLSIESYLRLIKEAKQKVKIPVIASLNGRSPGWWCRYAKEMEKAGADGLELNIYQVSADVSQSSESIEMDTLEIVRLVRKEVQIPLAVKICPFYTNVGNIAQRFQAAGANGLVLFNRFLQPEMDIETLEIKSKIPLGTSRDSQLAATWIALLYHRLKLDFAATGGVIEPRDAIRLILAGASVVMVCSALLEKGIGYISIIENEILDWMKRHHFSSLEDWRGLLSQHKHPSPESLVRLQYVGLLVSEERRRSHLGNKHFPNKVQ
ncbi:dihydroorotate dehydrogenase-like protein [Methylacidiphilum caldifontis]|uniref:dihydroorotate dehydrogenase-like protein n=1 Tax=Methylacidiphilum caldifontis TaxID=2795386 RepID=UPI001A8D9B56|nr:dihydroorotate dehydrogenase-like protein [Methylacidiphilum caldifontis]QSR88745.1 dihydroorotate dehydrogenase-like protein [Methylacidiphilum caldifontis]